MPKFDSPQWFQLVWLIFLSIPILGIFEKPRSAFEYSLSIGLILSFVVVFVWCYYAAPPNYELEIRPASVIGMLWSLFIFAVLFPIISWNGVGFLVYSGTFAGSQRTYRILLADSLLILMFFGIFLFIYPTFWQFLIIPFFAAAGGIGNHLGYIGQIANHELRLAQADIKRIAQVAERERIARDVHDLMGHSLSVIILKAELASRLFEKNPEKAKQEILAIENLARSGLQEVRAAVRGYRSLNLSTELENAKLALNAASIKLELLSLPFQLEWAQESALAYALREAITNTIRHSSAKVCWITLEPHGTNMQLEIWDDGYGTITEGNGIKGMRERLEKVGGQLKLETSNGNHGMQLLVPLQTEQP
jgi:two-component system, NarL family, sensor histidine kinase DesK